MKIDGSCHCGNITFEAEVDPDNVGICHCTDCQALSASAFRVGVTASEDDFKILSGELKIYVKTAESGTPRAQGFCGDCGTNIYSTSVGDGPKVYRLRTGAIRQRDQLPPQGQIWFRSAQSWVTEIGSIPRREMQT